ncbi:type IV secretion system protein VirB1 [Rhizobium sp. PP-F2F-G48]|uniref:lytic transglycosylase domain-containing protein n=1 Tax=Rhizobium sp. PP-F2F-G48 TaxID=2135651 RepID=UPI00104EE30C|nr:lytic transglycosylase domain-containing protein [Rhizobium sp. PP-F2F-G48]TCM51160.1 type IV secretion system protein VirB1 [Rhizobium sp. PP-F2F-G48]
MPIAFADIAQNCAPLIKTEILAAVVSIESSFDPLAIRLNSDAPRPERAQSRAEAIEIATTLVAEGHSIDLGLGGVSSYDLPRLGLSISDLFEPCLNLKATATLLDRYYRAAVATGTTGREAEAAMLQSYYGRGDAAVGAMFGYDQRIMEEQLRLADRLSALTLGSGGGAGSLQARELAAPASLAPQAPEDVTISAEAVTPPDEPVAASQAWDVFGQARQSTVLIFSR